ncbi:hypothetical protein ACFV3R_20255 [Streptomyces sp. NPDC059740]|uniref:hypothetical protein n=1 Tax=Streptomyces sp. NPDC059740 TaxID=3346926 RepID=UPI00364DB7E8
MSASRTLLTAGAAGTVLLALSFIPSAHATVENTFRGGVHRPAQHAAPVHPAGGHRNPGAHREDSVSLTGSGPESASLTVHWLAR